MPNKMKFHVQAVDNATKPLDGIKRKFDELLGGSKRADSGLGQFARSIGPAGKLVMGAGAAAGALALLYAGMKRVADASATMADAIDKGAARALMSVREYQELDFVFQRAGTSIQAMRRGMREFQELQARAMQGNSTALSSFASLGEQFNRNNIAQRSQNELWRESLRAVAAIENPILRAAKAKEIFGNSYQELLPLLSRGTEGVDDAFQATERYAVVLSDRATKALTEYKDAQAAARKSKEVLRGEIAAQFVPALTRIADAATRARSAIARLFAEVEFESPLAKLEEQIKHYETAIENLEKQESNIPQFTQYREQMLKNYRETLDNLREELKKHRAKIAEEDEDSDIAEPDPAEVKRIENAILNATRRLEDARNAAIQDARERALTQLRTAHERRLKEVEGIEQAETALRQEYTIAREQIIVHYEEQAQRERNAEMMRIAQEEARRKEQFDRAQTQVDRLHREIDFQEELMQISDENERRNAQELFYLDEKYRTMRERYGEHLEQIAEIEERERLGVIEAQAQRAQALQEMLIEQEKRAQQIRLNNTKANLQAIAGEIKGFAKLYRSIALAETIISVFKTGQKVFEGWAEVPYVGKFIGLAEMATAIGAGMVNVRAIRKQRLASGGVVRVGEQGPEDMYMSAMGQARVINRYETQRNENNQTNLTLNFQSAHGDTVREFEYAIRDHRADKVMDLVHGEIMKRSRN